MKKRFIPVVMFVGALSFQGAALAMYDPIWDHSRAAEWDGNNSMYAENSYTRSDYDAQFAQAQNNMYAQNSYSRSSYDSLYTQARADLSSMPSKIAPRGEKLFVFKPSTHMWAAYDALGNRVAYGRANGGSDFCQELGHPCHTPVGTFHVYSKGTAECKSRKFPMPIGGAPMPYCMYFNGGYAIHGSPYISYHNGSHGCIRVTTQAAQWLHQNFIKPGTKVIVLSY